MAKQEPDLRVFGLVKIGEKGQIVIPANAREELGLQPGNEVIVIGSVHKKFLGVISEKDSRELLTKMRQRLEQVSTMGDYFAGIAKQLDDLKK